MEQGGDAFAQLGDSPPKKAESNERGKGKGKEASFSGRMQSSGRMALNAVVGTQPIFAGLNNEKASSAAGPPGSMSQSSTSDLSLAETSRGRKKREFDSPRTVESDRGQVFAQYEQFINASPQLQEPPLSNSRTQSHTGSLTENQPFQEPREEDGEDVVQLLSILDQEPKYEELDGTLSRDEITRLREALFFGRSSELSWDRLLNFEPDFVLDSKTCDGARLHMGIADAAAAHDIWLQQWHDVLVSYTDEVWGDLGSLAREARQEIEKIEESGRHRDTRDAESKALGRLRQILSHVRGHL